VRENERRGGHTEAGSSSRSILYVQLRVVCVGDYFLEILCFCCAIVGLWVAIEEVRGVCLDVSFWGEARLLQRQTG
jgi:hypothetical protein